MKFRVDGKVKAKQSVKFARVGNFVRKYTPKEMVDYANWVKICFRNAYPNHLPSIFFEKQLEVQITACFEIPKSYSKKKRELALGGFMRPTVKPDCDNISKNILDALNGLAYPDDKQIVSLIVLKKYTESPYVEIEINELN